MPTTRRDTVQTRQTPGLNDGEKIPTRTEAPKKTDIISKHVVCIM